MSEITTAIKPIGVTVSDCLRPRCESPRLRDPSPHKYFLPETSHLVNSSTILESPSTQTQPTSLLSPRITPTIWYLSNMSTRTMDTEFPLPVPMHRPFITLDPQYDEPLPFRRALKKVTELNAENAIPYKLPKSRPMSRLELLPFEIRQRIYAYVGFDPRYWRYEDYSYERSYEFWRQQFTEYIVCACSTQRRDIAYSFGNWDLLEVVANVLSLLHVNRGFRAQLLDLMLHGQTVKFKHYPRNEWSYQGKPMSESERHNYWSSAWTPKRLECWTFEFLRHVCIAKDISWNTNSKATCYAFRKHLHAIRCIAEHCPLLVSLYAALSKPCCMKKKLRYTESVAMVYGELAQKFQDLEVVGILLWT